MADDLKQSPQKDTNQPLPEESALPSTPPQDAVVVSQDDEDQETENLKEELPFSTPGATRETGKEEATPPGAKTGTSGEDTAASLSVSSTNSSPKKSRLKVLAGALTLFLVLISIPLAVFLVQKNQQIEEKAAGEGKLVCMPLDNKGNLTNEKYKYNRIKVINNTNRQVAIWIQENLCPYQGTAPAPGYQCNQYAKRYPNNLSSGQSKIYSINVPNCQIGQLDVAQDDEAMGTYGPDCYNTVDQQIWGGGIAFTIKANSQCAPQTTPTPTPPITAQCREIKVYNLLWETISLKQLSNLQPGDQIKLAVRGETNREEIDKARFRVNAGSWQEAIKPRMIDPFDTKEFYIDYVIPEGTTDFTVQAEIHHQTLGWK